MPGARSVGRITACGYPPALRGIGGYRLWRYSPYGTFERASCLLLKLLVVPALASCFAFPGEFLLQASKRLAHHSEGKPGARSVGRITACGYPPALQGIGGYRLWRYSPYGTFERASCLVVKLFSVPALASCFAFPSEFLLQASKRNQKTRPGIRPQPLLGWGALAASLLPAARRHGPSWTEAALAASCHSSPSATIPLGLLTGRVCRPTTWRANLTSCMPGTRSVGRITASGYSPYGSGLRYVEVWHARGHPPS